MGKRCRDYALSGTGYCMTGQDKKQVDFWHGLCYDVGEGGVNHGQ